MEKKSKGVKLLLNLEKKVIIPGDYLTGMAYMEIEGEELDDNFAIELKIFGYERILLSKEISLKSVTGSKFAAGNPNRVTKDGKCIADEEDYNFFIKHKFNLLDYNKEDKKFTLCCSIPDKENQNCLNNLENYKEKIQLKIPFSVLLPSSLPSSFKLGYLFEKYEDCLPVAQLGEVNYFSILSFRNIQKEIKDKRHFLIQQPLHKDPTFWPKVQEINSDSLFGFFSAKIRISLHKEYYRFGETVRIEYKKTSGMSRKNFKYVEGMLKRVIILRSKGGKVKVFEDTLYHHREETEILIKENFAKISFELQNSWKYFKDRSQVGYVPSCKSTQISCDYIFESKLAINNFYSEKIIDLKRLTIPIMQDSRSISSDYFKPDFISWDPYIADPQILKISRKRSNLVKIEPSEFNTLYNQKNCGRFSRRSFETCVADESPPRVSYYKDEYIKYKPRSEKEQEEMELNFEEDLQLDDRVDPNEFFVFSENGNELESVKFCLNGVMDSRGDENGNC